MFFSKKKTALILKLSLPPKIANFEKFDFSPKIEIFLLLNHKFQNHFDFNFDAGTFFLVKSQFYN